MTGGQALGIEALSKEAFRSFGDVIETRGAETRLINQGTTTRFHDLADIDVDAAGGTPLFSIFEARARPRPIAVRMMERHPLGSQAFFPLLEHDWLAVVCEGAAAPDVATMRCFRATGQQGVNYRRGVWHHPLLVLAPRQPFVVIDRGGDGRNLEEALLDEGDCRIISP